MVPTAVQKNFLGDAYRFLDGRAFVLVPYVRQSDGLWDLWSVRTSPLGLRIIIASFNVRDPTHLGITGTDLK
jgi:hypothetical protein